MSRKQDPGVAGARAAWRYRGNERPAFAIRPNPDQESVWDYPRPPVVEADPRPVTVHADGLLIADTRHALRVLETGSPPTFYLPLVDVDTTLLEAVTGTTFCEWKGYAHYWTLVLPMRRIERVAWSYPTPYPEFVDLREHLAFYPGELDCRVGGERVRGQAGRYYGGWITAELAGPFKGEPGTGHW